MMVFPQIVLAAYGLDKKEIEVEAFGSGLINNTWKIKYGSSEYILQRVNQEVFKQPNDIANNISLIGAYLRKQFPDYTFVSPVISETGNEIVYEEGEGYFRMFPFVSGSHSIDVVQTPAQAFEAAVQFGRFTRLLRGIDIDKIKITIPHFHNLSLRYQQFLLAIEKGNKQRIDESAALIKTVLSNDDIVKEYKRIKTDPSFLLRVTHHDTKISNVLFDVNDKGICVIDLDTVMPGYFISDVGDMMRTYLSPVSEEESDINKIEVRNDFYHAIVQGYYNEMKDELTDVEKEHFFYAGEFMIYMQAIRFLTDHLNNDIYYGAKYPGHNFNRALNQLTLLKKLQGREKDLHGY